MGKTTRIREQNFEEISEFQHDKSHTDSFAFENLKRVLPAVEAVGLADDIIASALRGPVLLAG